MYILLNHNKIPNDLLDYFEPVYDEKPDVWRIATQAFSSAHFATFPTKLVEPMIRAGTSEKGCCPECRGPWERVTGKGKFIPMRWKPGDDKTQRAQRAMSNATEPSPTSAMVRGGVNTKITTGWRPTCECHGHFETIESDSDFLKPLRVYIPDEDAPEPIPCTVLDMFCGSGTTGLVADRLGRDAILIDLRAEYAEMTRQRIANDAGWVTDVEVEEETAVTQMGLFEGDG